MDYEKEYKEALERAKLYHHNELAGTRQEMTEYIFPELRESEDEIHRKWILEYLYDGLRKTDEPFKDHFKSAIDWFEKQKEQKPNIEHIQQSWYMEGYKDCEHNREPKWIIKTGEGGPRYEENPKYGQKLVKEQKLETFNEPYDPDECEVVMEGNAISLKRKEQKLVDYDHEMWKNCEANFDGGKKEVIEHPERYGLQKPAEWSKEDETRLTNIIIMLQEYVIHHYSKDDVNKSVDWLKALPERFNLQPKPEWSEEDELKLGAIITDIETRSYLAESVKIKYVSFLKSLRPSWKPSEEQIEALETAERWYSDNMGCNSVLISLYEQLKKL